MILIKYEDYCIRSAVYLFSGRYLSAVDKVGRGEAFKCISLIILYYLLATSDNFS